MPATARRARRSFGGFALSVMSVGLMFGCGKEPPPAEQPTKAQKENGSTTKPAPELHSEIQSEPWGEIEGQPIVQYFLTNKNGMKVSLINLGATITSVDVPDRNGTKADVTLGFPTVEGYEKNSPYFGCATGRYANRIAGGKFKIGEKEFTLATNNGPNHLHGGIKAFHRKVWHAETVAVAGEPPAVKFTLESPDGDEGYPGTLKVSVVYSLSEANELKIVYSAQTDKPTVLNLTNHTYWNLTGLPEKNTILDHLLTLSADRYLPADESLIPTGELKAVDGTPLDFRKAEKVGARIDQVEGGYDHCYVINDGGKKLTLAARVEEPNSGRVMEVLTTEPGIQFYTGNFLDGSDAVGKFVKHSGLCLETQHYPDSPNKPEFPTTLLSPGEVFSSTTVYKFSTLK